MVTTLAVLAVLIAAVLGFAATRPDTFRVERTTDIRAPGEKIFGLIDDFHRWVDWSPWEGLDPDLKRNYSGAARGRGAVYAWEGGGKVGAGRMEITESQSPSKIVIKLDFLRPFEAHNIAEFTLEARDGGVRVGWVMHGPNRFIGKLMGLFFSMDRMVGRSFEQGLANMKRVAEA